MNSRPSKAGQENCKSLEKTKTKDNEAREVTDSGKNWRASTENSTVATTITESLKSESSSCEKSSQEQQDSRSGLKPLAQKPEAKVESQGKTKIRTSSYSSEVTNYKTEGLERGEKGLIRSERKGKKDSYAFLESASGEKKASPAHLDQVLDLSSTNKAHAIANYQQKNEKKQNFKKDFGNDNIRIKEFEDLKENNRVSNLKKCLEMDSNSRKHLFDEIDSPSELEDDKNNNDGSQEREGIECGGPEVDEEEVVPEKKEQQKIGLSNSFIFNLPCKKSKVEQILEELSARKDFKFYSLKLREVLHNVYSGEGEQNGQEGNDEGQGGLPQKGTGVFSLKAEDKRENELNSIFEFVSMRQKVALNLPFYDLSCERELPKAQLFEDKEEEIQEEQREENLTGVDFSDIFQLYLFDNKIEINDEPEFNYAKIFGIITYEDELEEEKYLEKFISQELSSSRQGNPLLQQTEKQLFPSSSQMGAVNLFSDMDPQLHVAQIQNQDFLAVGLDATSTPQQGLFGVQRSQTNPHFGGNLDLANTNGASLNTLGLLSTRVSQNTGMVEDSFDHQIASRQSISEKNSTCLNSETTFTKSFIGQGAWDRADRQDMYPAENNYNDSFINNCEINTFGNEIASHSNYKDGVSHPSLGQYAPSASIQEFQEETNANLYKQQSNSINSMQNYTNANANEQGYDAGHLSHREFRGGKGPREGVAGFCGKNSTADAVSGYDEDNDYETQNIIYQQQIECLSEDDSFILEEEERLRRLEIQEQRRKEYQERKEWERKNGHYGYKNDYKRKFKKYGQKDFYSKNSTNHYKGKRNFNSHKAYKEDMPYYKNKYSRYQDRKEGTFTRKRYDDRREKGTGYNSYKGGYKAGSRNSFTNREGKREYSEYVPQRNQRGSKRGYNTQNKKNFSRKNNFNKQRNRADFDYHYDY